MGLQTLQLKHAWLHTDSSVTGNVTTKQLCNWKHFVNYFNISTNYHFVIMMLKMCFLYFMKLYSASSVMLDNNFWSLKNTLIEA